MPEPVVNGLLPGRGPDGRGAGFGPGVGVACAAGAGAVGASGAGAVGCAGGGVAGVWGVTVGVGAAASGVGMADGGPAVAGVGDAGAGLLADFLVVGAASAGFASGYASRSFRATGASIVDDADLTNSPSSASLARASLLLMPSSLATSCTRALATILRPGPARVRAYSCR